MWYDIGRANNNDINANLQESGLDLEEKVVRGDEYKKIHIILESEEIGSECWTYCAGPEGLTRAELIHNIADAYEWSGYLRFLENPRVLTGALYDEEDHVIKARFSS